MNNCKLKYWNLAGLVHKLRLLIKIYQIYLISLTFHEPPPPIAENVVYEWPFTQCCFKFKFRHFHDNSYLKIIFIANARLFKLWNCFHTYSYILFASNFTNRVHQKNILKRLLLFNATRLWLAFLSKFLYLQKEQHRLAIHPRCKSWTWQGATLVNIV